MVPNKTLKLPLFSDIAKDVSLPTGDLLTFGVNPYTGNVVIYYQDNDKALIFIKVILKQLSDFFNIENFEVELRKAV